MKQQLKTIIVRILEWQTRRLLASSDTKVIGVAGSIGKTSTKLMIARSLSKLHAVRYQEGNYNAPVTVPLVLFGHKNPGRVTNVLAWLKIILLNELQLLRTYPYEYVVLELGTDAPGDLSKFANYLSLDIAIVTAVTPEHMQFFDSLDAVAKEELEIFRFTKQGLMNIDLVDTRYLKENQINVPVTTYGKSAAADYQLRIEVESRRFSIVKNDEILLSDSYPFLQLPRLYTVTAAVAVLQLLGIRDDELLETIKRTMEEPTPGRLNILKGIKQSIILDDTYNASPDAMKLALNILYGVVAPQKIAVLGSMNELGSSSPDEHAAIGSYCDASQISLLITIGEDAKNYLAPAAKIAGCEVKSFLSPIEAGEYLAEHLRDGAFILAKGSQNRVFAEEAIKPLLKNRQDEQLLVRQTPYWIQKKQQQFRGMVRE